MTEDRVWFLYTAEGQQGPYTAAELQAFLAAGQITTEWNVWREGLAAWQPIAVTLDLVPSVEIPVEATTPPVAADPGPEPYSNPPAATAALTNDPLAHAVVTATRAASVPVAKPIAAEGGLKPAAITHTVEPAPVKAVPQRPGCITALCILLLLAAALSALLIFTSVGTKAMVEAELGALERAWVFFGFFLAVGAAIGLWRMQKWGLWLYIVFAVIDLLLAFTVPGLVIKGIIISGLWKFKDEME